MGGGDCSVSGDVPPQSGAYLYYQTKSFGQEICRVFSESYEIYVQEYIFNKFCDLGRPRLNDTFPFVVVWKDALQVLHLGLEINLEKLPSRCQTFLTLNDIPHGRFLNN